MLILIATSLFMDEESANITYVDIEESIDYKLYTSDYEGLLNDSTILVKVEKLIVNEEEHSGDSDREVVEQYTPTKVKILEVYKAPTDDILGTEIVIDEPYYAIIQDNGDVVIYAFAGYREMKDHEAYLLFLTAYRDDENNQHYAITGIYQGKFPYGVLTNKSVNSFTLESLQISEKKKTIYQLLIGTVIRGLADTDFSK